MTELNADSIVEEITRIHRSLPSRPSIKQVEESKTLIAEVDREHRIKVDGIMEHRVEGHEDIQELFKILQEIKCTMVCFHHEEKKRDALKLLDIEALHLKFDDFVQRAFECLPSNSTDARNVNYSKHSLGMDDTETDEDSGKLRLIKLACMIQVSAKEEATELNLSEKLSDRIESLPDSLGKMLSLISLNLSENKISFLPETLGGLTSLKDLDLHGNRIQSLPESIRDLSSLTTLNLRGNNLKSLPDSISRLIHLQELDLSSNGLSTLPETIGSLTSLERLNLEFNKLDEIPCTICDCAMLRELRADYNNLRALPESLGHVSKLEILTLRYNNVTQLPATMSAFTSLRELDVTFNKLEAIPENLCRVTTLVKIDVSNNFGCFQSLPRSIGNLEMLEELLVHNNLIWSLPRSFGMLSRLRVLNLDGNPLTLPARDVIENGAQAVVRYMDNLSNDQTKEEKSNSIEKIKKSWAKKKLFFLKTHKRKRFYGNVEYTSLKKDRED